MLDTLGQLQSDNSTLISNEDRRAGARYRANVRVSCVPVKTINTPPPVWSGQVVNLSNYGIGMVLPKTLGNGQLLEIDLRRKNGSLVRIMLARVVHEAQETSKSCYVGCAFVRELEDEHLQFFKAQAVHPTSPDCRRWTRFSCNVETVCYTSDTAPGERRSARILNISAGGIGLLLRCEFSEGTLLHFELPPEMNLACANVLVRVVRVMPHGDGNWILGCEFADALSEDELKGLLR
jgi:hypothetical protein